MFAQPTPLETMITSGQILTFKNVLTKEIFRFPAACQKIFMPYVNAGRLVPIIPDSTGVAKIQEEKRNRKRRRVEAEDEDMEPEENLEKQGNLFVPVNFNVARRKLTPNKRIKRNHQFSDEDQENAAPVSKSLKFMQM